MTAPEPQHRAHSRLAAGPDSRLAAGEEALLRPVRLGNAFEDTVARLLETIRLGIVHPGESRRGRRDGAGQAHGRRPHPA